MSFKVAFVGAGSIGFTRNLVRDLLAVPEFNGLSIALMDIDQRNLDMVHRLLERDIKANQLDGVDLSVTTDQTEAVTDAKYVFNVARVGGLEAFRTDIEIPLRYGIDQCVGDTLCAGGIMYGQRGIPMILGLCDDIVEHADPECLLLNYANPNAMMTWAANHYGGVYTLGLCHGVQGGARQIADAFGLPVEELDYICAGINHQTWYIQLLHRGQDLTDRLLAVMEANPELAEKEKVRIDMLRRFGYYSTESNGHLSEYLPWYRKRPEEIKDWVSLDSWINGETGGYLRVCEEARDWFKTDFPNWMKEEPGKIVGGERSSEHGSYIVEGLETGRVYRGHFNVVNQGCIENLPEDAIVEVPGYVDGNGISIPLVGELPLGCAAVCQSSISVQRLAVEAAVHGDDTLLRQSMLLDPLTGAVCNPPEVWQLVDDMLIEQAAWLPQYTTAIAEAKERRANSARLPTREGYQGAARQKTRTVKEMAEDREAARRNAAAADKAGFTAKEST